MTNSKIKKAIYNFRMKLANLIKPKRKIVKPLGKVGKLMLVEGSDRVHVNLFNNTIDVNFSLRNIIKAIK